MTSAFLHWLLVQQRPLIQRASLLFNSFKNSKNLKDYDLSISALHFSVGSLSFKSLRYPLKINKINKKPPLLTQGLAWAVFTPSDRQVKSKWGKTYYKKYHIFFYAGRPLYNIYYFSIYLALPLSTLKIDFGDIIPIILMGYTPELWARTRARSYSNCQMLRKGLKIHPSCSQGICGCLYSWFLVKCI